MKKNNKIITICSLILAITPIIIYLSVYKLFPEKIPMSFSFSGEIQDYGSKLELLIIPVLTLAVFIMYKIIPKIDPKRDNYKKFSKFYDLFLLITMGFMNIMLACIILETLKPDTIKINIVVPFFIGIMFIVMGNYMPQAKPNYFIGIKTPWTLSSEVVWIKTHRIAGYVFILSGFILMIMPLFSQSFFPAFMVSMFILFVIPSGMSYIYYKQEQEKKLP